MKPLFFEPGKYAPVLLAPMAGVTDAVFRGICRAMGADFSYTEMVSAKGMHYNNANTESLLCTAAEETSYGVQLFGSEPDMIAEAVRQLCSGSYPGLAVIDINMGCPAHKIVKNGEGSALMKNETLAGRVIEAAVREANIPVSVKFRKGWDDAHINAVSFARMAQASGASLLTVHGRTREQMYTGRADKAIIGEVVSAVSIPVIGNGDIFCASDALDMLSETGCAGVMVARGAQGNPFIFREIRAALDGGATSAPTAAQRIDAAIAHTRLLHAQKGACAVRELRKHIAWYITGMRGAGEIRRRANAATDADALIDMLEEYKRSLLS